MSETISCTGPLWVWTGAKGGAWHFVSIGGAAAEVLSGTALMRRLEGLGRGFGSLKVTARVGETAWQTSVFPQKDEDGAAEWLLPVKAAVRRAERLAAGEPVALTLTF
jgi:hypothetical protein